MRHLTTKATMSRRSVPSIPHPIADCVHAAISLPRALAARIRADSDKRAVPLKLPLYEAVAARIEQVAAEPKDRPHRRVTRYDSGSEMLNYSLPVALHTRCVGVANSYHDADGNSTGTLSYVFRRCVSLHFPDPVPTEAAPPKEPPVASVIVLIPVPPNICDWMRKQRADMSKQIRGAIDEFVSSVGSNPAVNRASAPYKGKGRMRPVPVRIPVDMHAQLKAAAASRGTTMSTIVRVCVALSISAQVRASTHKSPTPAAEPQPQGAPA